jgi:hypothetical protein
MTITYQKYAALRNGDGKERPFAYLRTIAVESPQTGKAKIGIEIEASSVTIDVVKNIRFEIPSSYKKMD